MSRKKASYPEFDKTHTLERDFIQILTSRSPEKKISLKSVKVFASLRYDFNFCIFAGFKFHLQEGPHFDQRSLSEVQ